MRIARKASEKARIEIIPMIDVMMFLLFFFMVASLALVVQAGLPVNLPKASTAASTIARQASQSDTSAWYASARRPLVRMAATASLADASSRR